MPVYKHKGNAKSLEKLRDQINDRCEGRSKISDGMIGDERHRKNKSDHNPNSKGIVTALDITHDPAHGCDGQKLVDAVVAARDDRIEYIIWNHKIIAGNRGPKPWVARAYGGSNPHTKHVHFSVDKDYDSQREWDLGNFGGDGSITIPTAPSNPVLSKGTKGHDVGRLQRALNKHGARPKLSEDEHFGEKTETAVEKFQAKHKLWVDGIVGPYTWDALESPI